MFESVYTEKELQRAQRPPLEERLAEYVRNGQVVSGIFTATILLEHSINKVQNLAYGPRPSQLQPIYDALHANPGTLITIGGATLFVSLIGEDLLRRNSKPYKGAADSSEYKP